MTLNSLSLWKKTKHTLLLFLKIEEKKNVYIEIILQDKTSVIKIYF